MSVREPMSPQPGNGPARRSDCPNVLTDAWITLRVWLAIERGRLDSTCSWCRGTVRDAEAIREDPDVYCSQQCRDELVEHSWANPI